MGLINGPNVSGPEVSGPNVSGPNLSGSNQVNRISVNRIAMGPISEESLRGLCGPVGSTKKERLSLNISITFECTQIFAAEFDIMWRVGLAHT